MKSTIKLFLVLTTFTVFLYAWLSHQLDNPRSQLLIVTLVAVSLAAFFIMNRLERLEQRKKRAERESKTKNKSLQVNESQKRSDVSFALKDRKSGLAWGGGNIKASEATKEAMRKFHGR